MQHAMVSRRDKHCLCASGAEVAEPAQRATKLVAQRRGLQGHPGRPWGHQPWRGVGWRRPRPACGRRASFLHIHVSYTHAASLCNSHALPPPNGVTPNADRRRRFDSDDFVIIDGTASRTDGVGAWWPVSGVRVRGRGRVINCNDRRPFFSRGRWSDWRFHFPVKQRLYA